MAASVVLLAVWVLLELRVTHPLVDLRQVRNRSVLTADVSGFLISIAMYLLLPIIVEFVQIPPSAGYGFAASLVVSGLILTPLSVGSFVASRLLIGYERRFGPRTMIPLGSLVFAAGAAFFALEHRALWEAYAAVAVCGLGVGFTTGAMPGFIIRAVPQSETGSATGFYQVVRSIGLTLGSALSAAVLMAHTQPGHTLPDAAGFETALLLAAGLCLVTALVSYVLPGRTPPPGGLSADEEEDLEMLMKEEAELGGVGLAAGEQLPAGPETDRP
jgi:MFS family permease